jgi:hypothetical protein
MTETDADHICLLPDRSFSPFQGFGDLTDRVFDFECAFSARTSLFVQATRAEIFVLGINCAPSLPEIILPSLRAEIADSPLVACVFITLPASWELSSE